MVGIVSARDVSVKRSIPSDVKNTGVNIVGMSFLIGPAVGLGA